MLNSLEGNSLERKGTTTRIGSKGWSRRGCAQNGRTDGEGAGMVGVCEITRQKPWVGVGAAPGRVSKQASKQARLQPTTRSGTRPGSGRFLRAHCHGLCHGHWDGEWLGPPSMSAQRGERAASGLAANSGADEDNATRRRAYNCNEPRVQTTRARENGEIERCRERIMMNGRVSDGAASNGSRVSFAARTKCERRVESFSQGQGRRCDDGDEP